MADSPKYVVLVQTSEAGGQTWEDCGAIEAASGDAAIGKLRDRIPELKADRDALYVAVSESRFRKRRYRRQLVERFALDDADKPDDEPQQQGTLT